MKKLSIVFLLAIVASSCQDFTEELSGTAEDHSIVTRAAEAEMQDYYWYQGEKINLTVDKSYVNVVMDNAVSEAPVSVSLFEKAGVELDKSVQFDGMVKLKIISEKASAVEYTKTIASLKQDEQVKYVLPYFDRGAGVEPIGTSDIFYLKLKAPEDVGMLKKMAAELGVQVIEEIPHTPQWYTLSIIGSDFSSSIEASNHFYETGKFEDVDPAFMFDFKPSVDDPEFWRQWGMDNTSYPNHDINGFQAWAVTRGAGIKVAIVDSPIQSNHTDLDGNIHSFSYNANLKQMPSAPYDPNYYPPYLINFANHGTHIAGIVAAEKNGSMVTGVAYESKIVRVSHYLTITSTTASELASGINWAWKATNDGGAGVDVINCSWGDQGGDDDYAELHSTILESAISDALTKGRNNKGCVVVFASGNYGNSVYARIDYPGNFHPNILVVGGIDESGNRSYTSSGGTQLDVVAPGGFIWSTIYPSTTGNMSGTSMAAPHVAGIAALILSENPNFSQQQVANRIESTAKKIGGYNYYHNPSRPNGTWNNEMGYGLVDARAAVTGTPPLIVPNNPIISSELIPYLHPHFMTLVISVDNPQSGVTYQWEINGIVPYKSDPYIAFLSHISTNGTQATSRSLTLRCRAVRNGVYSGWSSPLYQSVQSYTPVNYTPPI